MDLAGLVNSFATATGYAVTRRVSSGFDSHGVAKPTTDSTINITASVQPATDQDLLRLPEGRRTNETRVLFTTTQLFTGDEGLSTEADLVLIDGDLWEVQKVGVFLDSQSRTTAYRCIVQQPTPESSG